MTTTLPPHSAADDFEPTGDVPIPEAEIAAAIAEIDGELDPVEHQCRELCERIYLEFYHSNNVNSDRSDQIANDMREPFLVKPEKRQALIDRFSTYGRLANSGNPDGREKIARSAIVWGHLIQMEMKKEVNPAPTIEVAVERTFLKVFEVTDIARIRQPLVTFLKDYWEYDVVPVERFLESKLAESRRPGTRPVMGGIKDPRCKYVDSEDQQRPASSLIDSVRRSR